MGEHLHEIRFENCTLFIFVLLYATSSRDLIDCTIKAGLLVKTSSYAYKSMYISMYISRMSLIYIYKYRDMLHWHLSKIDT